MRDTVRVLGRSTGSLFVAAAVVAGCSSDGATTSAPTTAAVSSEPAPDTTVRDTTVAPETTEPVDDLVAAGGTRLTVDGGLDWMAIAAGAVFGASDQVVKLDPATGAIAGSVPVGGVCLAMDVGFDSLWVGNCDAGQVVRIDPATMAVLATIDLGPGGLQPESSLAAGEGGVFAVSEDGTTISRIDPATNTVQAQLPAPAASSAVRAGFGSLWVTAWAADTLYRLDPVSGAVQATIEVGDGPRFLTVGSDAVWTLDQNAGTVTRVDPATNSPAASIDVDGGAISGGDIAAGGRFVWARVTTSVVAQIDAATNEVVATFGPPAGSGSVAATADVAWISAHDSNTVWRVPLG